jgi:DNA-binding beta-propeller fold protein YncE
VPGLARIVYVSNGRGDTVTPIAAVAGTPGPPIPIGPAPGEIVVTPDGKTAYITTDDPVVVPIATATGTPGPPIMVGVNRPGLSDKPVAIAITPKDSTVYAANTEDADGGSGTVTPIDTATNTAGPPIPVGKWPHAITITPDGATAYVTSWQDGTVTPIATVSNTPGPPIHVGEGARAIAITPDGKPPMSSSGLSQAPWCRSRPPPTCGGHRSRSATDRTRDPGRVHCMVSRVAGL